ncbi:AGAP008716-PA, partial [Anopheles gambiae str. PEST]
MSQPSEKQTQTSPTYGTPTLNDWKLYLRNLQQLPTQQTMAARDSSSSESSFELEESFKALLQRKRQEMQEKACEEHFLAAEGGSRDAARSAPVPQSGNDSTFLERDSISNISDTSFEEMEKICAVLDKVNGFDTSVKEERHKPATATMPGSVTLLGDVTQLEEI